MENINNWNNMNNIFNRTETENNIKNILINFQENCKNINFKKGIYLYGSPGSGKTFFIKQILKDLDYDIISYDAGDVRNKNLIDTITSNNISSHNVLDMMNRKKKKIAIIMDEIDGMNNGDKGGIGALIKIIRQKKTKKQKLENVSLNPIICIGNYFFDKKIKELMKVCNVFELKTPVNKEISMFLNNMNVSNSIKNKSIEYIQGDLRKLQFIEQLYKSGHLLNENFIDNILKVKCHNEDSKNITALLFKNEYKIEEHNTFMNENDRTIVSLLWHENVIDNINSNKIKKPIALYLKMLDNICFSDYIDRITFQNQIWQFNEMSSLMKTFYNNKLYHDALNKKNKIVNDVRFTKVLTKYSTEYNNQVFLFNMCQEFNMDKKDLIAFFQELRLYVEDEIENNPEILEELFENYNINKLDIKRIYRFLDKNVKKESIIEELSDND